MRVKDKKGIIVVIFLCLICALLGMIISNKFLEKETNNIEDTKLSDNINGQKEKKLTVGSVGENNKEVDFYVGYGNVEFEGKLSIENGKVIYTLKDGKIIKDTSINEEVISIVSGKDGCSFDSHTFIVLTKKGNVYMFDNSKLEQQKNNQFNFYFNKVLADQKIYGIASLKIKSGSTCGSEEYYAFVNEKEEDAKQISRHVTYNNWQGKVYLGNTYGEKYPYEEAYLLSLDTPFLGIEKDGKVKIIDDYNQYLVYEENYIYVNNKNDIEGKMSDDSKTETFKITAKDGNKYELLIEKNEYSNTTITLKKI